MRSDIRPDRRSIGGGVCALGDGRERPGTRGMERCDRRPAVLADLQRDLSVVNIVGLSLELLGWVALVDVPGLPLPRAAAGRGLRTGGWRPVAFGSGLIMVSIKLGSVAPLMAAWYRRDDLTVTTATTLSDLGGAAVRRVRVGDRPARRLGRRLGARLRSPPALAGLVRDGQRRRDPRRRHRGDHGPGGLHSAAIPGRTPVDPHHQRGPHRPGVPRVRQHELVEPTVPTGVAARQ